MKPRLIKRGEFWFCVWGLLCGMGKTEIEAYNDWLKEAYPYNWGTKVI